MSKFFSYSFKKNSSMQKSYLLLIFFVLFFCSFILAAVAQQLLVPQSALHAPNSILTPDSLFYHEAAAKLARLVNVEGWSAWNFFPLHFEVGQTSHKFLAILYVFFGENPLLVIPINSFFNALSGVLIYIISFDIINSKRASLLAATLFIFFPSSIVAYSQISKDVYINTGVLLLTLTFLRVLGRPLNLFFLLKYFCLYLAAIFLIAINKIYILQFLIFQIGAIVIFQFFKIFPKSPLKILFFSFAFLATFFCYQQIEKNNIIDQPPLFAHYQNNTQNSNVNWEWINSSVIPKYVDNKLNYIASLRSHFINYGFMMKAGSMVDIDQIPTNAGEVFSYFPRGLFIAMFAPFPKSWFADNSLVKLISSFEMLVIYCVFFGLIFLLIYGFDYKVALIILLTIMPLTLYGFISPNLGTLHRVRFVYVILVLVLGFLGWSKFIKSFNFSNKFRFKQK